VTHSIDSGGQCIRLILAIQAKLEDLIVSNQEPTPMVVNQEPYRLLREMRDQQDDNERTMGILGQRLKYSAR
jgi:low affinity Fe/Cu permease